MGRVYSHPIILATFLWGFIFNENSFNYDNRDLKCRGKKAYNNGRNIWWFSGGR